MRKGCGPEKRPGSQVFFSISCFIERKVFRSRKVSCTSWMLQKKSGWLRQNPLKVAHCHITHIHRTFAGLPARQYCVPQILNLQTEVVCPIFFSSFNSASIYFKYCLLQNQTKDNICNDCRLFVIFQLK